MPLTSPTSIASCSQPNASASALPLDAPNSGELSSPSDTGDSGLIREAADLILRHTAGTGVFRAPSPASRSTASRRTTSLNGRLAK